MGKEDKKTLTTGETWSLSAGYELTINAIDASSHKTGSGSVGKKMDL